ncbi:aldehyde dehydrogenase [Amycolatopsis deserti]|uniref:Aldehyde dehydrogenase n=1 Tax=Amycolatopsis deserti TaxID=185696 RepID=A0ABQ3J8V4_9PSEU|nr:xanthine dehydrogenase family protein molybdopterin-binding subunit [Amycolatopsis deserti]GHF08737.1 aldehyde dehydrogenase [Amycolatopsis deserti]
MPEPSTVRIGQPLRRREDRRHLAGRGRFTDDIAAATRALHAVVLRSPHAHARIRAIDTTRAETAPGVVTVLTGAHLLDTIAPLPATWVLPGMTVPEHRALAVDIARFHGDGIAVVVAETAAAAQDALEAIEVSYEPLAAVTDPLAAAQDGAPVVRSTVDGNVAFRFPVRGGDYRQAKARADVVIRRRLRNQNLVPGALEPRSVLAEYDPVRERLTVHSTTQGPHALKRQLAGVLRFPEHRIRVVAPDVGGGFGAKLHLYPEEALVAALAMRLGRPVRWTATRGEDFLATNHGRDHVQDVELCATADGVITGVKATIWANLGAYLSGMGAGVPAVNCGLMLTGVYRIPHVEVDTIGVYTHTSRVDTYRGAGRPEATYLIERMVDELARELHLDPAEIRRRNFIPVDAFPYRQPTGAVVYDSGDYERNLDEALNLADYRRLREEQAALRRQGRYRGIGLCTYTEFTGIGDGRVLNMLGFAFGGWEYARVLVHPDGTVTVHTGSADHGQGHATTYAQIAADVLNLPPEDIDVVEGDTAQVEFGLGTFNSRSMPVGGAAVHRAAGRVLAKARLIAAHALGVPPAEVGHGPGVFTGPDGSNALSWQEVARLAHFVPGLPGGVEPGLDERIFHQPENLTFPFGTSIAVVDVDPDTGDIAIDRFVAVDDCGTIINPLLVRGQIHGGLAQGLGQALLEGARYADDGTLTTADWMRYPFPRAQQLPRFETGHTITPSPVNPLGVKGVGEAGAIAAPPAVVNAVLDALAPLGVTHLDMPMSPERVRAAIATASEEAAR